MDRSKELRVLMKQKASSFGTTSSSSFSKTGQFGALSGKEKAKLIKTLRDKHRQESEAQEASLKRHAPTRIPTHTLRSPNPDSVPKPVKVVSFHHNLDSGPANSFSISQAKIESVSAPSSESNLLNGFFDEDIDTNSLISEIALPSANAAMSAALIETYENSSAAAAPTSANSAGLSRRNEAITAVMTTDSLLPSGFFDDPEADSKARGIDTAKISEVLDRQAEEDLQRLLNEVSDLPSVEDIDESDLQTQEFEEEATQLAYMTRVAALMHHASSVASDLLHHQQEDQQLEGRRHHHEVIDRIQRIDDTLAEAQSVITFNQSSRLLSSGVSSSDSKSSDKSSVGTADVESDIERIFRLKREAKKKRKREEEEIMAGVEADAGFYGGEFMDNIDWMARSI